MTYRCHWAFSVLTAIAAGIFTNAPTVASKALASTTWQNALPTTLSGVGLLMSLVLGFWMARRAKKPFVSVPGFASCCAGLGMVFAREPLWFLLLLGFLNLFETITRPAMTAIIRVCYPVETRGLVTGKLRQWSAGSFMLAALATGAVLDENESWPVVQAVFASAVAFQACAYLSISLIPVPAESLDDGEPAHDWRPLLQDATTTLRRDSKFLRYLIGCFVFGTSSVLYDPIIRPYFIHELHLNYKECVVLADVLPSLCSVLTVHRLGAWLDRTNPLMAWAAIRLLWGLDPLLLSIASLWAPGAVAVAAVARSFRGSVMGGSFILWWQLGTNYFTRRPELTSVYMGIHISLNGVQRICGPPLGVFLGVHLPRREVLFIGGIMVMVSAVLAWRQGEDEKTDGRYPTFADKERGDIAA